MDIIGDAPAQRYAAALESLLEEPGADAVLFIHVPTAIVPPSRLRAPAHPPALQHRVARACSSAGWAETRSMKRATFFAAAGIPTYATPEEAVAAFLQLVNYRRNQETLMETPRSRRKPPCPTLRQRAM